MDRDSPQKPGLETQADVIKLVESYASAPSTINHDEVVKLVCDVSSSFSDEFLLSLLSQLLRLQREKPHLLLSIAGNLDSDLSLVGH